VRGLNRLLCFQAAVSTLSKIHGSASTRGLVNVDSVGTPAKMKSGIFAGNNISIFNPLHMKRVDAMVGFLGDWSKPIVKVAQNPGFQ
jgi:hypothetical protein